MKCCLQFVCLFCLVVLPALAQARNQARNQARPPARKAVAPAVRPGVSVTQKSATTNARGFYGPIVTAYLTSLRESLQELDFHVQHNEMTRADYALARLRLLTLRRLVQERAHETKLDQVPEFQVLTLAEFGMVGLSQSPDPEKLQIGNIFDEAWKLVRIEPSKPTFYVFEKQPLTLGSGRERLIERQNERVFAPAEVIETIEVVERTFLTPALLAEDKTAAPTGAPNRNAAATSPAATTTATPPATRPRRTRAPGNPLP